MAALRLRYPKAKMQALADGAKENWRILGELERDLGFRFDLQSGRYAIAWDAIAANANIEITVLTEPTRKKPQPPCAA